MLAKPSNIYLVCNVCKNDKTFSTKQKLRQHLKTHSLSLETDFKGRPCKQQIKQSDQPVGCDVYGCPCCNSFFISLDELDNHISIHIIETDNDNSEEKRSEINPSDEHDNPQHEPITISTTLSIEDCKSESIIQTRHNNKRSYEESILFACQKMKSEEDDKKQTLYIVDTLHLKPYKLTNERGEEANVLAHLTAVDKFISTSSLISPTVPSKKRYFDVDSTFNTCGRCLTNHPHELETVISQSPYKKLLNTRNFMEISDSLCNLLNTDWLMYSNMKQPSGRTKSTDIHRELFGAKKQSSVKTSLPPPIITKYNNIWPTTMHSNDGEKLVIGTLSCNILVTSSIRIDKAEKPVVGATMHMDLNQRYDSLSISIYLDKQSVDRALALAKDKKCISIYNSYFLGQLRQLNTHFDDASTYYLCRASGSITQSHQCQPYSIFTLADFDKGMNPAARIFSTIGINVLQKGRKACLNRDIVVESLEASNNENINKVLLELLALFNTDESIQILSNNTLNKHLEKLAILMHPYLITANKSIESTILQTFEYLD
ncbi:uncharacterized protein BX663DRAFT_513961 [Cokeromyces recurvatus]|uniref:uncharacterized protein n=1 Tax=Cokeromyces recurvatus TaxID=90255 RepID=UPI00221F5138|nr:uncharacterized protein BX663DRAFT_513961 [Cokeromyces recurvatus]KAI7901761.1 hypothetical protein BX663DRAFT_513961 [Cokeromyces recurvatus]